MLEGHHDQYGWRLGVVEARPESIPTSAVQRTVKDVSTSHRIVLASKKRLVFSQLEESNDHLHCCFFREILEKAERRAKRQKTSASWGRQATVQSNAPFPLLRRCYWMRVVGLYDEHPPRTSSWITEANRFCLALTAVKNLYFCGDDWSGSAELSMRTASSPPKLIVVMPIADVVAMGLVDFRG